MFKKILIANRGEIACRVAATARRLGIRTVAVYSQADARARHVALCDEAVLIGPAEARDSYLQFERIIAVARECGAEAIHPGYGFLSENAPFARACAEAGLVFIGPPPDAIDAMGSKSRAKTLMAEAGVPLVPGYHGERQDADFLHGEADRIGYPVLLKASAGGGGKGMRVVDTSAQFQGALASCRREALSAFGDDQILLEKYLIRPRHIEIQVFADTLEHYVYLFERDCSVQRRHQKVLEEAPAPGMTAELRATMGATALAAARAVGYVGAGTVEFIVDQSGTFYFMEMNTRLQVEHPVTEMITGQDLVEWQLRVAYGEPLPCTQEQLRIDGHAIEARIYAENPERGFLPSTGLLRHLRMPAAAMFNRELDGRPATVRIDAGVREGDAISPFYDPMIAKLIVHGATRAQALAQMAQALREWQIVGLASNLAFLGRLIASPAFAAADLDTGLIERNHDLLLGTRGAVPAPVLALAALAVMAGERAGTQAAPWDAACGWRLNGRQVRTLHFTDEAQEPKHDHTLRVEYLADGWRISGAAETMHATLLACSGARQSFTLSAAIAVERHGQLRETRLEADVRREDDTLHIFHDGAHYTLNWQDPWRHAGASESAGGRLTAPMPGKIIAVLVGAGQQVQEGDALLIMEAMKMEHTITAPNAGTVDAVLYAVGDQVADGAPLLRFEQETAQ